MEPASRTDFAPTRFIIGAMLLLLALMFYYFAVLKVDYYKTGLLDLGWSDASHYFAQAKAMMKDGYPYLDFGYDRLPPIYPSGYPALMLPWLKILPKAESILAPFRTNQTIGVLSVLATFGFYSYLKMPLTGGFAALLLATLPGFFTFCRSSMSEISASSLVALGFLFAYLGLKEERRWKIYLSAFCLGLSLNVRVQSVFFAPLLLSAALFPSQGKRLCWLLHCAVVVSVYTLAASPFLVLNTIQFHSPFKTGYDFWLAGDWSVRSALFSPHYVLQNAVTLWREFTLQPRTYSPARYFGTGTCFVAPFMLLVCIGLLFIRFSRFVICAFLAGLSYLAVTVSFAFGQDVRYYLPLLLLLVAVAVLPVTSAAQNLLAKREMASLAIFILFAATCLGYPSRSVSNMPQNLALGGLMQKNRSQAWDALYFPSPPVPSPWFTAQKHFLEMFGHRPGMILADINPLYLNALLPDSFVAVPLDGKRYVMWRHVVSYDRAQALALVKRALDQSRPIYALFVSQNEMAEKKGRLPQLDGYEWVPAKTSVRDVVILTLNPNNEE